MWASDVIFFWNYGLEKAELLKCAKSPCVRTFMEIQHFKGSETLLKPTRHYFCSIFWSLWKKIIKKSSFLEVSEILRLFVNILTPDDKSFHSVKASVQSNQLKGNYLKTKKKFSEFFLSFRYLHKICNTLKKSWASEVIAFWNYWLGKAELLKCTKSHRVRTLMEIQHFKGSETLLKFERQYFCDIFWSLWKKIWLKTLF